MPDFELGTIVGPPQPENKLQELQKTVGKTIVRVEIGEQGTNALTHTAEMMVIHFSDGTALTVLIGSNVDNVFADLRSGHKTVQSLKLRDFHTDLILLWQ